ncbi:hypothetical protein [Paraburkholderia bryophila]|uniref:Uncharacterized protein n=1 Tax=Paraburkholderia bryophila TaxID=420952 RepID=A0A7Y9W6L7_9BURK|nr:hypothetical protein [Paraburkholderia bryophila]NYH14603.1 hypothetical protein [Paraburkholderia bryophila]
MNAFLLYFLWTSIRPIRLRVQRVQRVRNAIAMGRNGVSFNPRYSASSMGDEHGGGTRYRRMTREGVRKMLDAGITPFL